MAAGAPAFRTAYSSKVDLTVTYSVCAQAGQRRRAAGREGKGGSSGQHEHAWARHGGTQRRWLEPMLACMQRGRPRPFPQQTAHAHPVVVLLPPHLLGHGKVVRPPRPALGCRAGPGKPAEQLSAHPMLPGHSGRGCAVCRRRRERRRRRVAPAGGGSGRLTCGVGLPKIAQEPVVGRAAGVIVLHRGGRKGGEISLAQPTAACRPAAPTVKRRLPAMATGCILCRPGLPG